MKRYEFVWVVLAAWFLGGCVSTAKPDYEVAEVQPSPPPGLASGSESPGSHSSNLRAEDLRGEVEKVIDGLISNREGTLYANAVAGTDIDDLAVAIVLTDGSEVSAGDTSVRFPLMSISKPFTYALAVEQHGASYMFDRVGVSATGLPYNAVAAGAIRHSTEQNPMVNAGAIATHSFIEGEDARAKSDEVVDFYSRLANQSLSVNETWRATPRPLTYTLAYQMKAADRLVGNVDDVVNRYLEACIVGVSVAELAQMGATLANGGVQPITHERVVSMETAQTVLSVMVIAGMYEESGSWWVRVGLPAKSGVSGAIMAVVPGWGAIVAYSPRLDKAGNSVRAALAIEQLAKRWGLHTLARVLGK